MSPSLDHVCCFFPVSSKSITAKIRYTLLACASHANAGAVFCAGVLFALHLMSLHRAGDSTSGQDGCVIPLAEHNLWEGFLALPFLQVLALGSGVVTANLYVYNFYQI